MQVFLHSHLLSVYSSRGVAGLANSFVSGRGHLGSGQETIFWTHKGHFSCMYRGMPLVFGNCVSSERLLWLHEIAAGKTLKAKPYCREKATMSKTNKHGILIVSLIVCIS